MELESVRDPSAPLDAIDRYIRCNIDQPLTRGVLADMAGYSVPHFHRVFIGTKGESAASYIRRLRLRRAGYKLRFGAIDIGEVALAAGYASHAAFGKAFKKQYGLSPSAFRQLDCWEATRLLREEQDS
ncbi:MAG: helix-turn-helix transcriptional regulator [Chloroflexi bacterium]|nr:helix-turn-helix transcriptional regulator [Chloroflexota bacterium]